MRRCSWIVWRVARTNTLLPYQCPAQALPLISAFFIDSVTSLGWVGAEACGQGHPILRVRFSVELGRVSLYSKFLDTKCKQKATDAA